VLVCGLPRRATFFRKRNVPFAGRAFFPALVNGRLREGGGVMRRLWHLLEVILLYAAKRLIDWFFDKKEQ
ncbi:MAG: hypothetical protein K2O70_01415, partial [Desulfovibrionaceae bacterium]|nr:hypothetical protein [Desulfovibrionaceae bacterium]